MLSNVFHLFAAGQCQDNTFFGLLPWYHYLNLNATCGFDSTHPFIFLGANSSALLILLAVVDDLLRLAGLLAVFFVIFSGVKFILSNGSPDEAAKARQTGINALIGLAITIVSVSLVSFLGNVVGGGTGEKGVTTHLDLTSLPNPFGVANGSIIHTGLSIAFGVIGALSFMIIVIAGYRYILAQGDPKASTDARNTIIYALVGLVIAIAAQSVVSLAAQR